MGRFPHRLEPGFHIQVQYLPSADGDEMPATMGFDPPESGVHQQQSQFAATMGSQHRQ
jgi:hypothetical protein